MAGANVRTGAGGIEGGGVSYEGPVGGTRFGLEAVYERALDETEPERRGVFTWGVTMRFGVVSSALEDKCRFDCAVKPLIDFGPVAGLGVGFDGDLDPVGHGFVGGWVDLRLGSKKGDHHPVLRVELQQDAYAGGLRGGTQLVVGLGWVDWKYDFKWP
jgi:hypothetical protein